MTGSENNNSQIAEFISDLGAHVRQRRKYRNWSRKALASASGVSERYLAQLEAGSGNISITVLCKVAGALEVSPQELFSSSSVFQKMDGLPRSNRICLIGLRGAGKSTLGPKLAKNLNYPFIELNTIISHEGGMPTEEIIALYGQEGYRKLEFKALKSMLSYTEPFVLAIGGGIVSDPVTFSFLLANFFSVWLKAAPQDHMDRVLRQGDIRPIAGNPNAMEELLSILIAREKDYSKADIVIDTAGKSIEQSAYELHTTIKGLIHS